MKTIDEDIKNGTYKPIYLLFGEELYLRNQYAKKLKDAIGAGDMNTSVFTEKGFDVREVIDLSETVPFLAPHRLIVLEDSRLTKESNDLFADYVASIPETTVFLLVESEVDKRNRVYKEIAKAGRAVEFKQQNEKTLTTWILSKVKRENKQITNGAVSALFERCGTDMVCLDSELEKLFSYTYGRDAIRQEDVETICPKQTEANVFDMITNVAVGNRKEALDLYYEMLAMKEPPMRILYLLSRQFNQLLQIRMLNEAGRGIDSIAKALSMNDYIVKKCLGQSRRFTIDELRAAVEECVALEEAVKTGKLIDTMSVELMIAKYGSRRSA